jgi:transketolase
MKPAIRIAAISKLPVIYVFTHDSIGVGEDGPTHQPIEQLAMLRAIPNLTVIRPAGANETLEAWKIAVTRQAGPTALTLTRQSVPTLNEPNGLVERGAYVLHDFGDNKPELILMASGSEVNLVYQAGKQLSEEGLNVRVVSFPSWELFEAQDEAYRESVLPKDVRARLAVEAGAGSAPANILFEKFGFTVENVITKAKELL